MYVSVAKNTVSLAQHSSAAAETTTIWELLVTGAKLFGLQKALVRKNTLKRRGWSGMKNADHRGIHALVTTQIWRMNSEYYAHCGLEKRLTRRDSV